METLYIKNMVCNRCIMVVKQALEELGLHPEKVSLGEVILDDETLNDEQLSKLDARLFRLGFERIDDRKSRLMESIKNLIIQKIHHDENNTQKLNWSTILSEELHYEYNLCNLFSSHSTLFLKLIY